MHPTEARAAATPPARHRFSSLKRLILLAGFLLPGCIVGGPIYGLEAATEPFRRQPRVPPLTERSWHEPSGGRVSLGVVEYPRRPNLLLVPLNVVSTASFNLLPAVSILGIPETVDGVNQDDSTGGDLATGRDTDWFVHVQAGTFIGVCGGITLVAFDVGI